MKAGDRKQKSEVRIKSAGLTSESCLLFSVSYFIVPRSAFIVFLSRAYRAHPARLVRGFFSEFTQLEKFHQRFDGSD